jgi:amino acid adenylation domain-containing protein
MRRVGFVSGQDDLLAGFPAGVLDRVAVMDDSGARLTYRHLDSAANALALRLRALGVKPGVLAGICHERSAASIVGALAVLRAGGGYVGLDPAHSDARLTTLCEDAGIEVLLTHASMLHRLPSIACSVLDLDAALNSPSALQRIEPTARPDDVAYVVYTAGSADTSNGVRVSRASLRSLIDWHNYAFGVNVGDHASVVASPASDASVWETWPYLVGGACLHIPDDDTTSTPAALRQWLLDTHITIGFVPTAMAELLLDLPWPADAALRAMLTGGDVLHRRPAPAMPFALVNNYGVPEAAVVSTSGVVTPDGTGLPGIGRAIAGTTLRVITPDGHLAEMGAPGELCISGPSVALGYVNRPELTAERFAIDPFATEPGTRMYRTGDRARISDDGNVELLGRVDDNQVPLELDEVAAT